MEKKCSVQSRQDGVHCGTDRGKGPATTVGGTACSQSGVRMARDRRNGQKLREGKLHSTGNRKAGREGKDFKGRQFKKSL